MLGPIRLRGLAATVVLGSPAVLAQDFSDDFESYANGSSLDGQGGWQGWDGVDQNLTLVNQTFAFGGTQSVSIMEGADTVHEFDHTSGQVSISAQVYIPGNSGGSHWFILMDEYVVGGTKEWGGQVEFNNTTGLIECDCGGANAFTTPILYDQWVEIRAEVDLDADFAEIYYDGVLLGSWVWSTGTSGTDDNTPIGFKAVDLYAETGGPMKRTYFDDVKVVGASTCLVDLDIDSDNDDGGGPPDNSAAEEAIEDRPPGKILCANTDDDDNNGIPDAQDTQPVAGEDDLVTITLAPTPNTAPGRVRISYTGDLKVYLDGTHLPSGTELACPVPSVYRVEGLDRTGPGGASLSVELDCDGDGSFDEVDSVVATVLAPILEETRFASLEDDTSIPPGSGSPAPVATEYHHLGLVSPLVLIDDNETNLTDDEVEISGRVISTTELVGQDHAPTLLFVDGELIPYDADGYFQATLMREHARDLVVVSACNVLGGWGWDAVEIDGDEARAVEHTSAEPTYQRLRFGDAASSGWLTTGHAITLELVQVQALGGGTVASIPLELSIEGGQVLSSPFLVSELGHVRNDPEVAKIASLLAAPPPLIEPALDLALYHDLRLRLDGIPLCTFEFAGLRLIDPAPEDIAVTALDSELTEYQTTELRLRNVPSQTLHVLRSSDMFDETLDITTYFGSPPDPDAPEPYVAGNVPYRAGINVLGMDAKDGAGRELLSVFGRVHKVDEDWPSIWATKAIGWNIAFDKVARKNVHFPILPDTPPATISGELRRLGLTPIAVLIDPKPDACGEPAKTLHLAVWPKNGNVAMAQQAIKNSPIHADATYLEQPNVAFEVRPANVPLADDWHSALLGIKDWPKAIRAAERGMNNRRAKHTAPLFAAGGHSRTVFVADMRVKATGFQTGGEIKTVYKDASDPYKPLDSIAANPPTYLNVDPQGNPSYKVLALTYAGVDQKAQGPFEHNAQPNSGRPPRVKLTRANLGIGQPGLEKVITKETKGLVIHVHGFNNYGLIQELSSEWDMPQTLWPFTQHLLRQHGLPKDVAILFVAWTGDWMPNEGLNSALWFNWDNALAVDAGRRVLRRLVEHVVAIKDGHDPEGKKGNGVIDDPAWKGVAIMAESLGNRVAVSALAELQKTYPLTAKNGGNANSVTFPRTRYVLAHPALRRKNFDVNDPSTGSDVLNTNLQQEMRGINEHPESTLMYWSPHDKAGIAFGHAQGTEMLGRCGLPLGYDPAIPATVLVKVLPVYSQQNTVFRDLWHVDLMGWTLPDMYFHSRPTYDGNDPSILTTYWSVTAQDRLFIHVQNQHIQPIWKAIAGYFDAGKLTIGKQ